MEKPFEIQESPNKPNITYIVKCMQKVDEHELYFSGWLMNLDQKGHLAKEQSFIAKL